ncbi:RNA polymerase sigma factor [Planctomycetales bacterium ZRK34]|nr:RNA polymerase sigma factor [Planctomycetales bacterium ZRK34]
MSRDNAEPRAASAEQPLIHQAQRGDPQALHALVDRYADSLYSTAVYLLGSEPDAQDVTQETLMAMVTNIRRFEHRSAFRTWLWGILVRQVNRKRRDQFRHRRQPDMHTRTSSAGVGPEQVRLDVQSALDKLGDDHRQILILREFDGLSYEQIAEVLSIPRGTVESRLHRARQAMREQLADYASTETTRHE